MTDRSRDTVPVPSEAISHFGLIKSCKDLHLSQAAGQFFEKHSDSIPNRSTMSNMEPVDHQMVPGECGACQRTELRGSILQDLQMAV